MQKYSIQAYLDLLTNAGFVTEYNLYNAGDRQIDNLTYDSREVCANTLFVCKGAAFKAAYLEQSAANGAILYVSEQKYEIGMDIPYILVSNIREAMPYLGRFFYNDPSRAFKLIGVGGTKGKSTTVYYIKAILDDFLAAGNMPESAMISSIDTYDGVMRYESHITTPESLELFKHFRNAADSKIPFLEMEVSSQALKYNRVDEILFDVGIFMNISEDHISPIEHPDFEDYFASKLKLFAKTKTALVCTDSEHLERILQEASAASRVITFGTKAGSDIYGYHIRKENHQILFDVKCDRFQETFVLTMPGLFNVENALAAIAAAYVFDIPVEYMHSGLFRARSAGRMEAYHSADNKVVAIVDYAHNKLSFEKLFDSTKKEYPDSEIVAIFGCPGKKALLRRRDLGTIAGMYAKKVYLVAEDPGAEPVIDISTDIAQYVSAQNCPYEMIEDRGEAITKAILEAAVPTVILITGKGNETRQKYGTQYLACKSDVEYTKEALAAYDQLHS